MNRNEPHIVGMVQLGDALTSAMASPDRRLSDNGGKGWTIMHLTTQTFTRRCRRLGLSDVEIQNAAVKAEAEYKKGVKLCESPIECMVLAALVHADWPGCMTIPPIVHDPKNDDQIPEGDIFIVPQMAFVRYRFDFGIVVDVDGMKRIAVIECDGEAFHSDKMRDAKRDAYIEAWNIPVFRMTGADIYRDVAECVGIVASLVGRWREKASDNLQAGA